MLPKSAPEPLFQLRVYYTTKSGANHSAVITTTHTLRSLDALEDGQLRRATTAMLDQLGLELLSIQVESLIGETL